MSALVVLLHGFTGAPASFSRVIEELADKDSTLVFLVPWLHGHGPTADLSAGSFDDEVRRIAALVRERAADYDRVHLCGYSLGGRVALGLLCLAEGLFDGATIIGAHPGLADGERVARRAQDAEWISLLESGGVDSFVERWQAQPLFGSQARLPEALRVAQAAQRREHDPRGLVSALSVLGLSGMPDLRTALRDTTVGPRLLAGSLDEKFVALGRQLASEVPGASFESVVGCGHNVVLEAPGVVARAIVRSLDGAGR